MRKYYNIYITQKREGLPQASFLGGMYFRRRKRAKQALRYLLRVNRTVLKGVIVRRQSSRQFTYEEDRPGNPWRILDQ